MNILGLRRTAEPELVHCPAHGKHNRLGVSGGGGGGMGAGVRERQKKQLKKTFKFGLK